MQAAASGTGGEKLGLALSGGGFRASLFHIGVLARLADLGLLRRVEVISTVSGGSIIGALYYLYLRALLQRQSDEKISDSHYQEVVATTLGSFLEVVQTNLRMRTFQSFSKNWKMYRPDYSRADHLGELFDELLYRPAFGGEAGRKVQMRQIKVTPKKNGEAQSEFKPKTGNAGRKAKVPIILINATDLNSGHNWRFEASRMGEPDQPGPIEIDVDKNLRLKRPDSYAEVVEEQQDVEVGHAVGASAAVPGLFPPLSLSGLYPGIRVRLADGGAHDNQGVQGLIDPDTACTHFVVSDASALLQDEEEPEIGSLDVLRRSSDVQFDRIREEQVIPLVRKHGSQAAYLHLRKGLGVRFVPWIGPREKPGPDAKEDPPRDMSGSFGIDPEVQKRLSRIRTDLDSFSDIEAYSLMLDGYNMSRPELEALRATLGPDGVPDDLRVREPGKWVFLEIEPWAAGTARAGRARYLEHLEVAAHRFFKPFRLNTWLLVLGLAVLAAVLVGLYLLLREPINWLISQPLWTLLVVLGAAAVGRLALKLWKAFDALRLLRNPIEIATRFLGMLAVALLGALTVRVYLWTFNRLFLWMGRVERLK